MTGATINDEKELPACPVDELSVPVASIKRTDRTGGEDEEDSLPTPTLPSLDSSVTSSSSSSSASSSPSISPSSSITTDTSVASDTRPQGVHMADKHAQERHKVDERAPGLTDDDNAIVSTSNPDSDTVDSATINPNTTSITTPTSEPSTPASSSSTSLPGPTPFSSSTPSSTSPSTTNVNDQGGGGDSNNGLTSLLRPRPQMNQNLNVKFAPLPELAPRKRKSSTPLGMAARSQLARRRRMTYQDSYDDDGTYEESYRTPPPKRMNPPEISEEEDPEGDASQEKKKKSKKKKEGEEGERREKKVKKEGEVEEEEDPLAALAKKMGRAGKHLWKKMASSGKVEKTDGGDETKKMKAGPVVVIGATTSELGDERRREGDGAVWIEEVGEQCRRLQEMRINGSIEAEASLRQAASTPLPPSDPPTPIDTTPTKTQAPNGGFPTPPTIVVSAA